MITEYLKNEYCNKWFKIVQKKYNKKVIYHCHICANSNLTINNFNNVNNVNNSILCNDWKCLSKNINLTIDFVLKNLDKKWDLYELLINPSLNKFIFKIPLPSSCKFLIQNYYIITIILIIIIIIILKINSNIKLTIESSTLFWLIFLSYWLVLLALYVNYLLCSSLICKIPINIILLLTSNWNYISYNENITIDFILNNLDKRWNWNVLSRNESISLKYILNNKKLNWNWHYVTQKKTLKIKDVLNNNDLPWDWNYISRNFYLTEYDILNNIDLPWSWYYLADNQYLPMGFVLNDINYKCTLISDIVETAFVTNNFDFDRNNYIKKNLKKILLANIINKKNNIIKFV